MASSRSSDHADANALPSAVVVHLAAYKAARRARDVLIDLLHGPGFLVRVDVALGATGEPSLVAVTTRADRWVQACIPSSVNDIPVIVRPIASEDYE